LAARCRRETTRQGTALQERKAVVIQARWLMTISVGRSAIGRSESVRHFRPTRPGEMNGDRFRNDANLPHDGPVQEPASGSLRRLVWAETIPDRGRDLMAPNGLTSHCQPGRLPVQRNTRRCRRGGPIYRLNTRAVRPRDTPGANQVEQGVTYGDLTPAAALNR
jgi:hypothetical protein